LFTDVGLPLGMNGRQLADAVRETRPNMPVQYSTGYARNVMVHHGMLDADVKLMVKPSPTRSGGQDPHHAVASRHLDTALSPRCDHHGRAGDDVLVNYGWFTRRLIRLVGG
jgi:CheY-like chemotaxis protein